MTRAWGENLIGQKFGRLTVISQGETKNGHRRWICKCECGNEKQVVHGVLKRGDTKSCGTESYERAALLGEIDMLRAAIRQTLNDNGHLADGDNCTLLVLKRALGIKTCRKCGADMQPGVAIGQTVTGMPDFIGGECCTVSPGGPGKLIECNKCPECGWSVTA